MADNNSSSIVAIFAIIVIVLIVAGIAYYFINSGKVGSTTIVEPTKVIAPATGNGNQ